MLAARHDSFYTRLGDRRSRKGWRLWIEDTGFARLGRNNFARHTPFVVRRRPGAGLVIGQALLSSTHVSTRRGANLLSYEAQDLCEFFGGPEVRVRIHVGTIVVVPQCRYQPAGAPAVETWKVTGTVLNTPAANVSLVTEKPIALPRRAHTIDVDLEEVNLVFATELIGNQRPARVVLRGIEHLVSIGQQFLAACGYGPSGVPGEFLR